MTPTVETKGYKASAKGDNPDVIAKDYTLKLKATSKGFMVSIADEGAKVIHLVPFKAFVDLWDKYEEIARKSHQDHEA